MKKQIFIIILFFLVGITGQCQIHYRLEGNIGMPNFTGIMELRDVLMQQTIDTIEVVNGIISPKEGNLPEMAICVLADTTKVTVIRDSGPHRDNRLTLGTLFVDNGTIQVEGLDGHGLKQSGTPIGDEIAFFYQRMAEIQKIDANHPSYEEGSTKNKTGMSALLYDAISRHTGDVYGINLLVNEGRWYLDAAKWIELLDKLMHDNGEYIRKAPNLADDLKRISREKHSGKWNNKYK